MNAITLYKHNNNTWIKVITKQWYKHKDRRLKMMNGVSWGISIYVYLVYCGRGVCVYLVKEYIVERVVSLVSMVFQSLLF